MVQTGNRTRFPLEALADFGVAGHMRRQDFDGDGAVEASVFRLNLSHSTRTNGREDLVGSETVTSAKSHGPSPGV